MKKDGFRFHRLRNAGEKDFQPKKIFSRRVRRLRRDDIGKEKGSGLQFWNLLQFFRKGRRGAICWRQVWRRGWRRRLCSGNGSGRRPQRNCPSNLRPADPDHPAPAKGL